MTSPERRNNRNQQGGGGADDASIVHGPALPSTPVAGTSSASILESTAVDDTTKENNHNASTTSNNTAAIPPNSERKQKRRRRNNPQTALRRVQRVSRQAALSTKKAVWDSNEISLKAAVRAVDQWEAGYNAIRLLVVTGVHHTCRVYDAAKQGAQQMNQGLLLPIRDWIVLPAFSGLEATTRYSALFLQSNQARLLAQASLHQARQVPVVGEHVLAPALCFCATFVQRTWEIVQYPIPSKAQVHDTVDFALTGTKWALTSAGREVFLYVRRADANITRTLSHTQWKVLGSGPYATLDKINKQQVIDHLTERYLSLFATAANSSSTGEEHDHNDDDHDNDDHAHHANSNVSASVVARYELAAHIKRHNAPLYQDLVLSGLLRQRGGDLTKDDEWLNPCPVYYYYYYHGGGGDDDVVDTPFLIPNNNTDKHHRRRHHHDDDDNDDDDVLPRVSALWFRLPSINGKRPGRDAPWVCFRRSEQYRLEERYLQVLQEGRKTQQQQQQQTKAVAGTQPDQAAAIDETAEYDAAAAAALLDALNFSPSRVVHRKRGEASTAPSASNNHDAEEKQEEEKEEETNDDDDDGDDKSDNDGVDDDSPNHHHDDDSSRHPTVAKWYDPDLTRDVLVDQKRQAVSMFPGCRSCRKPHGFTRSSRNTCFDLCDVCRRRREQEEQKQKVSTSGSGITSIPEQQVVDDSAVPATGTAASRTGSTGSSSSSGSSGTTGNSSGSDDTRSNDALMAANRVLQQPPSISAVMRPTLWRFHGPGDEVRRSTWFLEQNGLQPFDEDAQAVLEDAYLFLKWMAARQGESSSSSSTSDANGLDQALLTVEVNAPDGTVRLVQFSSLTQATAIQKGIGAAITIYKRRVYRGAWLQKKQLLQEDHHETSQRHLLDPEEQERQQEDERLAREVSVTEAIIHAATENGTLGETMVPNVSLRSIVAPPPPPPSLSSSASSRDEQGENRLALYDLAQNGMAVPPAKLWEGEMAKFLVDEDESNDVDHLCLIVHGIGEMLRTIDVFGLALPNLSSIIDCCGFLRKNHADIQDAPYFSQAMNPSNPDNEVGTSSSCATNGSSRVEYLPVEWHEAFTILSQRRTAFTPNSGDTENGNDYNKSVMLKDISLRTIPNMRDFANDTLMDVLYFMSPEHHDMIIDIVTNEMNVVVEKFRQLTGFTGRISLIGHSLGSIVSWDILAHQIKDSTGLDANDDANNIIRPTDAGRESMLPGMGSQGSIDEIPDHIPESNEVAPPPSQSHSRPSSYPRLDFDVDNFFSLGSPIAVFLMIRNQRKPLSEDFSLQGCSRVFNIFHPYDPVAYRIEPCIDPRNANFEPTIMKHWNGGFRVHYQTKRLWRKLVDTTFQTQQHVAEAFEASMAGMGLLDSSSAGDDSFPDDEMSEASSEDIGRVVTGQLNQGRRIDYMIQEKEIENANEYVAALAAHSSYWTEKDLALFIARQIYLSSVAKTTGLSPGATDSLSLQPTNSEE